MKEFADMVEREFKFVPTGSDEGVLARAREYLMPSWRLVQLPPRTILDVYFDAAGLPLERTGALFRLRRRRNGEGWMAHYKPAPIQGLDYFERREVRTCLSPTEALSYQSAELPGLAASLAQECLDRISVLEGSGPSARHLVPVVELVSRRHSYSIRTGDFEDRTSNLIHVIFDEVTAIDVRGADQPALVRSGFIDYSHPVTSATFAVAELEASGRSMHMEEEALTQMRALARKLVDDGAQCVSINKYQQATRALGISAVVSAPVDRIGTRPAPGSVSQAVLAPATAQDSLWRFDAGVPVRGP